MRSWKIGFARWVLVCAMAMLPLPAMAQDAVISGTITDSSDAVLPGVTVQAVHEASGNTFETVTDTAGTYRLPVRIGGYRIVASLPGFSTATRPGLQVLVGQTLTINLQLAVSALEETVTVTSEAPLIETTTSRVGGNVDSLQMTELPSQGRNWLSLALLAPGNRTNTQGSVPVQDRGDVREFQLNLDGMQVTSNLGFGNQPRYSTDMIAEFQFVSNRFDATQGRSSGVQVNVVTKSGTNRFAGSLVGNFRDSDWNADDHVLNRVLPYENQQISGTLGGPIVQNRTHFFGSYEYEHQPLSAIWTTPYPAFNITLEGNRPVKLASFRLDHELSSRTRVMGRVGRSTLFEPFGGVGSGNTSSSHPAGTGSNKEYNTDVATTLTTVFGSRVVNELRVGYNRFGFDQQPLVNWDNHPQSALGINLGAPRIVFRGFGVTANLFWPRYRNHDVYSFRDGLTLGWEGAGQHDLKIGGEYLLMRDDTQNCTRCMGIITANGGPVPANIESLFPVWNDVDTWNMGALWPITSRYTISVSDSSNYNTPLRMDKSAAWIQDDWKISSKLTLNLGLRYDLIWNAFAQSVVLEPFMAADRPQDANNLQPRVGFAYSLDDRTVLRGGSGLYYNDVLNTNLLHPRTAETVAFIAVDNVPQRADFVTNPFNGPAPTYEQALQRFCSANNVPGCLLRDFQELAPPPEYAHVTHSWQSSIGIARQIGGSTAVEVDFVNNASRNEKSIQDNINLTFDPATGIPYPYANTARRAYPTYGVVGMVPHTGQSDYRGLQANLTKRMSNRWQGSVTYTLGWLYDRDAKPLSGLRQYEGPVPADIGGERSLAATDQRHRAVFNGIWMVGKGFQVSGVYFYGSGMRDQIICGCDARGLQIPSIDRMRLDGTIIPRNSFVGRPIHRVETRVQQQVPLPGSASLNLYAEVFNLFNHENFGAYDLTETSRQFGQPIFSSNLSYAPRTLQLGFRLAF